MQRDPRIHIPKSKGPSLGRYTVSEPVAAVHRQKSRLSGLETQLLFGHQFDVYEKDKNWVWGQSHSPLARSKQQGYVGFVELKNLQDIIVTPDYVVTALKAPVFSNADIKSPIKKFLPLGALCKKKTKEGKFLELTSGEFIHLNHLRERNQALPSSDFVDVAERHMGLPYVWGGVSSQGLDCSGLVQSSLRAIGKDAPRDADMQEAELGSALAVNQRGLKRGDLIFWKGHVAIMISASKMIHANAYHMSVDIEPLRDAAKRILESGGGPITAIKRL